MSLLIAESLGGGGGVTITVDTRDALLATSPVSPQLGFASDTLRFYIWDGSDWRRMDLPYYVDDSNHDMGYVQDNAQDGYDPDFITDKAFYNVSIKGHPGTPVTGSFRIDVSQEPDTLEIFLRDIWQTIIYDLTTEYGDFRHTPVSLEIYVWRGSSVALGLNDRPIVNEYQTSMGVMPVPRVVNGGTF